MMNEMMQKRMKEIISKNKINIKAILMQELLESIQKLENEIKLHKSTSSLNELINVIENYKSKINEN